MEWPGAFVLRAWRAHGVSSSPLGCDEELAEGGDACDYDGWVDG